MNVCDICGKQAIHFAYDVDLYSGEFGIMESKCGKLHKGCKDHPAGATVFNTVTGEVSENVAGYRTEIIPNETEYPFST